MIKKLMNSIIHARTARFSFSRLSSNSRNVSRISAIVSPRLVAILSSLDSISNFIANDSSSSLEAC